jgi:hypothetical protein
VVHQILADRRSERRADRWRGRVRLGAGSRGGG